MKWILSLALVLAAAWAAIPAGAATSTPACGAHQGQYLGTATVDATTATGGANATVALPATGTYTAVACGTWTNTPWGYVDAAYNTGVDGLWNWTAPKQGWQPIGSSDWGEVQIGGKIPNWGAYSPQHVYQTQFTGSGTVTFSILDNYDDSPWFPGWYGDNLGSLSVDVYGTSVAPTNADQCKKDGWKSYGVFKNQGDCVSFVATGGKNLPAGA